METGPNFELHIDATLARYRTERRNALNIFFDGYGYNPETLLFVINTFLDLLKNPELLDTIPQFPDYRLPVEIQSNNAIVRNVMKEKLEALKDANPSRDAFIEFFTVNHENIKWSTNQWLLASPGVSLEVFTIPADTPSELAEWLLNEFGVAIDSQVIHRHVISNNGRERLAEMGFDVPFAQWNRSYYEKGMHLAKELALSSDKCAGVFSEGSWIYDTQLYSPHGETLAAFDFLKDDKLVGHRFPLVELPSLDPKRYAAQVSFATKQSKTRQALHESGKYTPVVTAVFYPKNELLESF